MIKVEIAENLIRNFGSKAKNTSPSYIAESFDDDLSKLLSDLSV